METRAALADRLKAARKAAGLRIGVAAARIGIDRITLWRYENGHTVPSTPVLRSVLAAYESDAPAPTEA